MMIFKKSMTTASLLILIVLMVLTVLIQPAPETMAAGSSPQTAPTAEPDPEQQPEPTAPVTVVKSLTTSPKKAVTTAETYGKFKVTLDDLGTGAKVIAVMTKLQTKECSIPDAVAAATGKKYSVTTIGDGAFKGSTVNKVTLGENVVKLGRKAFAGSATKTLKLESKAKNAKALSAKQVFSAAFNSRIKIINVPKSKLKEYKKIFLSAGQTKKVKIKAYD